MSRFPLAGVIVALAVSLSGAGCETNVKPGAQSIFEAVGQDTFTPRELVAMSGDAYDANQRYLGTLGLANLPFAGEPLYVERFEENAGDADASVRVAAIRALGMNGGPSHAPTLIKGLTDKDRLVRLESARALQRVYNDIAISPLIAAMREPDPMKKLPTESDAEVRAQAAGALGQYADSRVLQALIAGLDDTDLSVNRMSLTSLRTLTGQDLGLDRAAWIGWLQKASDPFAGRAVYYFPVFRRDAHWYESLPFMQRPPNERSAPPAGFPLQ